MSASDGGFSQWWLKSVISDRGATCGNCGHWRILHPAGEPIVFEIFESEGGGHAHVQLYREIEKCPNCGVEAYDIFEVDAEEACLPKRIQK